MNIDFKAYRSVPRVPVSQLRRGDSVVTGYTTRLTVCGVSATDTGSVRVMFSGTDPDDETVFVTYRELPADQKVPVKYHYSI